MYSNGGVALGGAATGGAMAATGVNLLWVILATFAFIAVGSAILRLLPKRK